jgi:hypothetical protein
VQPCLFRGEVDTGLAVRPIPPDHLPLVFRTDDLAEYRVEDLRRRVFGQWSLGTYGCLDEHPLSPAGGVYTQLSEENSADRRGRRR